MRFETFACGANFYHAAPAKVLLSASGTYLDGINVLCILYGRQEIHIVHLEININRDPSPLMNYRSKIGTGPPPPIIGGGM